MKKITYPNRRKLQEHYSKLLPLATSALNDFHLHLKSDLEKLGIHLSVKYRVKSFESYYKKLLKRMIDERKNGRRIPIHDILGIRIVCPFLEDLELVEELLRKEYTIFELERKGAQHTYREFGYKSTHVLIEMPEGITRKYSDLDSNICEVQLRTILQDAWAEVEHELVYKAHLTPLDEPLRRKLAALNANLSLSDIIFQEIRDYQRQLHSELEKRRDSFLCQIEERKSGIAPVRDKKQCIKEGVASRNPVFRASLDDLLLDALYAHNSKDFTSAIKIYSQILEHEIEAPLRAIVLIHRGMAFFSQAEYSRALSDFKAATECEPQNSRAFYHLGIVSRTLDLNAQAIMAFQKSIELSPYDFKALFALAMTFFEAGDFTAALEYCEKALCIDPDSSAATGYRNLILSRMEL